jgi:hypothetical protein
MDIWVEAKTQPWSGAYSPASILIQSADTILLERFAAALRVRYEGISPATTLLDNAAGIAALTEHIAWQTKQASAWQSRYFDPDKLHFDFQHQDEPHLVEITNPQTQQRQHLVISDRGVAAVDADWGRWFILHMRGRKVVAYHPDSHELEVPLTVPLPGVFARAMVLFSGRAPRRSRGDAKIQFDRYQGIPEIAAKQLMRSLGQLP